MNLFTRNKTAAAIKRYLGKPVSLAKSKMSLAWETMNPATELSIQEAQAVFDQARQGCYGRLHYIFSEIEQADPTLFICADRRASALSELDWKIKRSDVRRHRNADQGLAKDQIAFLETALADCANFYEGVEHLASAFFRGFAHVQPHYSKDGKTLKSFVALDNWNFCFDRVRQMWQWNPDASVRMPGENSGMDDIPADELVTLIRKRFIDYPALPIALRNRLGEKDWGRFLERYGVPPCTIIMPAFTDKAEEEKYLQAAQDMADAGNGALPFGSLVSYATEARGTDPFTAFLDHQQKLIVLMATGGLLTSLAEAGSGTLAGGAHEDSWDTIVRRDSRHVANVVNRQICERLLGLEFPNQPMLAEFAFETEAPESADEIFTTAGKAVACGYRVAQAQLQERTGYQLELAAPAAQTPWQGQNGVTAPVLNKQDAGKPVANPLQNASDGEDGKTTAKTEPPPQIASDALLRAFAKDMGPAGKAVADLLSIDDPEEMKAAAAALAKKLPDLLASDPEMVAVLEDEIARAFADSATEKNNG